MATTAIINDAALELGPANLYIAELPRASLTTAFGSNRDLTFRARNTGAEGNGIIIRYLLGGSGTAFSVDVDSTAINVTLATNSSGIGISTANDVKSGVNNSFSAYGLVYAVLASGSNGTGVQTTGLSSTPLAGGSDTETNRFLGGLGEATALNIAAAAAPITAHLSGTQPRDKIISGGSFQVNIPFKEMTLENFAAGFANAILIEGAGGLQRLDFTIRIGESLRQRRGAKMILKKVEGGVESSDPNDILTIPECSPVDATVSLAYSPTEQRVLAAVFEAWPDTNGRVAFWGTETL